MATKYAPPSPPFIPARYKGGSQTPKSIVIHGTVSSDNPGTARNIANWWAGKTSPVTSAHYTVDPKEVIQSVGDHTVAYHCGSNSNCIGVELCDEQTGPASRWSDADSTAILKRAARLVAELCLAYNIEVKRPSVADLKRKGKHGIYGHNDSRLAFGNTSHTDPRDFPWTKFINMVKTEVARIKGIATSPKPDPVIRKTFMSDVTVVVANVKSNPLMKPSAAQADYEKTFRAASVTGAQAVYLNEYHRSYAGALNAVAKKYGYSVKRENASGLAIAYKRKRWALSGAKYTKLVGGVSGVSPNRGVLRVGNTTPGKTRVVFDCTMLPRGWNNPKYGKYKVTSAMAKKQFAGLKTIVDGQIGKLNSLAIVAGDLNQGSKVDMARHLGLTPAASYVPDSDKVLDKMMQAHAFAPKGWTVKVAAGDLVQGTFNTDHRPFWVHFQVHRPV